MKPDAYYAKLCKKETEEKFDQEALAEQIKAYLDKGNKITKVPFGVVTGLLEYAPVVSKGVMNSEKPKQRIRN